MTKEANEWWPNKSCSWWSNLCWNDEAKFSPIEHFASHRADPTVGEWPIRKKGCQWPLRQRTMAILNMIKTRDIDRTPTISAWMRRTCTTADLDSNARRLHVWLVFGCSSKCRAINSLSQIISVCTAQMNKFPWHNKLYGVDRCSLRCVWISEKWCFRFDARAQPQHIPHGARAFLLQPPKLLRGVHDGNGAVSFGSAANAACFWVLLRIRYFSVRTAHTAVCSLFTFYEMNSCSTFPPPPTKMDFSKLAIYPAIGARCSVLPARALRMSFRHVIRWLFALFHIV